MRRLSAVPLGLLVAGLGAATARAGLAQQIPVRLGGMTSSFVGLAFNVPLEVDLTGRTDKLGSFAATITWSPAVLAFASGQDGTFGRLSVNVDSAGGVIRLTGANPGGVGGKVVLGVARFVPLAASSDTFRLDVTELYAAGTFADLLPSAVWANQPYCPAVGRFGDLDNSQTVNSADALQALSYATGLAITGNAALGDVDGDGTTGARDALLMLSAGIGLDVSGFRVFLVAPGACAVPRRPLLAMTPGNLTMNVGQQAQYTAYASDSVGVGVAVTDVVWNTSDSLVARVTSDGQVTAVAGGVATITVLRTSGAKATATVTVQQRHTHWVDALASPEDFNQLGAPELPFRTIPQALAYASPGDTVRVRSGRYDDTLTIDRPVVLIGDTTGGKPRPLLAAHWYASAGITVHTAGRVELQALRLDTLSVGVAVERADTLLVRWMEFRAAAQSYQASLFVDTADVVLIRRSDFFGPGSQYYYANDGIVVDSARVVSIDSSYVAEYGYDAIALYDVDSVTVRGSTIRDNYGHGVYYCAQCYGTGVASKAVFGENRFIQNNYGHVYVDNARTVRFDHNRATGGGYDGYTIYGDTATTLVTLRGDSLVTRDYGSWLYLYNFDSLAVDSTVVVVGSGYPSIDGGRVVSVRDSRFLNVTGEALDIGAYPQDSTNLILRRVEFRGPDSSSCDRCGDMVYGYYLNLDADSVKVVNAYYGLDLNYSRVRLRHVDFQHYGYGAYLDCGSADVAQASFSGGWNGLEVYGCDPADSVVVDSVSFAGHSNGALQASGVAATLVSRSQFSDSYYGIDHSCGQLRVSTVSVTGGERGVYGNGCGGTDSLVVDQSSFSQSYYGVDLEYGSSRISNSVFTDDDIGAYLYYSPAVVSANQFIRPRSQGVSHYWYSGATGSTAIQGNTVSCDAWGASGVEAIYVYRPYPGSDTVAVTGNTVTNCNSGVYQSGGRRAYVRNNTVALPTSVLGSYGIYLDADSTSEVVGNTVTGWGNQGSVHVQAVPSARVDSNTVSDAVAAGLVFPGSYDSLLVRYNTISRLAYSCCSISPSGAIQVNSSSTASTAPLAVIQRNQITDVTNGIVLQRGSGDTLTVRLDTNGVHGADSMGIWVRYYSKALAQYNAIDSSGLDAVRLSDNYRASPAGVLNNNSFTRNKHFGVRNLSTYVVDATNNFWGDNSGPACDTVCGSGDSVSTYVTFVPFETIPAAPALAVPRLVAVAPFAPPALTAAGTGAGSSRVWERPSVTPPQRVLSRPPARWAPAAAAGPAPAGAHAAVQRLEAVSRSQADRIQRRQAERAQMLEQRDARRAAMERARSEKQQAQASREAARQAREMAPRRPQ